MVIGSAQSIPHGAKATRRLLADRASHPALPADLRMGTEGQEVRRLQKSLVRWMPTWQGRLQVDGIYGPQTARAVEFFKETYGLGKDGRRLDPKTAQSLTQVESGSFWTQRLAPAIRKHRVQPFERARKRGYPFDFEERLRSLASRSPEKTVMLQGHRMQARTARRFLELTGRIKQALPGHSVLITCTTTGQHLDPAHPDGRAVDFVVLDRSGRDIEASRSVVLEALAREAGFTPYNEYLNDSLYKTGPHMHVSL